MSYHMLYFNILAGLKLIYCRIYTEAIKLSKEHEVTFGSREDASRSTHDSMELGRTIWTVGFTRIHRPAL